jgi:hypothetical protein
VVIGLLLLVVSLLGQRNAAAQAYQALSTEPTGLPRT